MSTAVDISAVQRQKAVSAYFTSKQILPFAFAKQISALRANRAKYNAGQASQMAVQHSARLTP